MNRFRIIPYGEFGLAFGHALTSPCAGEDDFNLQFGLEGYAGVRVPLGEDLALLPTVGLRHGWALAGPSAHAGTDLLLGVRLTLWDAGEKVADPSPPISPLKESVPTHNPTTVPRDDSTRESAAPPFGDPRRYAETFGAQRETMRTASRRYVALFFLQAFTTFDARALEHFATDPFIAAIWRIDPALVMTGIDEFLATGHYDGTIEHHAKAEAINVIRALRDLLSCTRNHRGSVEIPTAAFDPVVRRLLDPDDRAAPGVVMGANLYLVFLDESGALPLPSVATLERLRHLGCMNGHVDRLLERKRRLEKSL